MVKGSPTSHSSNIAETLAIKTTTTEIQLIGLSSYLCNSIQLLSRQRAEFGYENAYIASVNLIFAS